MTNEMIIMEAQSALLKAGKIGTTGRTITVKVLDADGNEGYREIEEPEEIHTFARWKELGYSVKKGEHAVAKFPIWKAASRKAKDGEEVEVANPAIFQKMVCFFSASQVERRAEA